jgi:hypothetical protein
MRRRGAAVLAVTALLLTGCVPANPDADTFDEETKRTAGTALSEVRTVERSLTLLGKERMLRPTAVAQMRYSQDGLGAAATAFTDLNPPPSRDGLAERLSTLLDEAEGLVVDARVAIEREAVEDYGDLARRLESVAQDLEAVEAGAG